MSHKALGLGLLLVCGACTGEVGEGPRPSGDGDSAVTLGPDGLPLAPGDRALPGPGPAAGDADGQGPPVSDAACDASRSGTPRLRRLSHWEYDNTVSDLLGVTSEAGHAFVADKVVHDFDNNAAALSVTPLLADQWASAAEALAERARDKILALAPCDPAQGDAACASAFVADFGKRAFRRPLSEEEVARYETLYGVGREGGDFGDGLQLVVSTMLQSPNFAYRTELGAVNGDALVLSDYEIASQLSYMLTGSMPDGPLLAAADAGELSDPSQLRAQAERLLDSPRGRAQFARFVRKWLSLDRLASVPKDAALFPMFSPDIRAAMIDEVDHFSAHVAFDEGGDLAALLTAPHTFVDGGLAAFYGMPAPTDVEADGFGRVDRPDDARAGVLTLGAVVTTHGRPDGTSPIHRGKLVRERVLCHELLPPPPGIVVQPPAVDPTRSTRERYSMHSSESVCHGCHQLIDPIGFAFEHLDGVGRYRADEGGHAIDATGEIVGSALSEQPFDGTVELAGVLAGSDEVTACFALQWFRFAYGEDETPSTACAVDRLTEAFASSGGSLRGLMLSLATAPIVRTRLAVGLPDDNAGATDGGPSSPSEEPANDDGDGGPVTPMMDPSGPDDSDGITTRVVTDSSWGQGRCDTVFVRNEQDAEVSWMVTVDVRGTLTNNWNSSAQGASGQVTFTGADHNRNLPPFGETDFGYCVSF